MNKTKTQPREYTHHNINDPACCVFCEKLESEQESPTDCAGVEDTPEAEKAFSERIRNIAWEKK